MGDRRRVVSDVPRDESSVFAAASTQASHSGFRQGPGTQRGTHAPSVLWRLMTVSTACPQAGQAYVSLSMSSA